MDGPPVAATMPLPPWQSPRSISIDVSSTHYPCRRRPDFFSPRSYNFVFCVPVPVKYGNDDDDDDEEEEEHDDEHEHHHEDEDKDDRKYTKWFTISIRADGPCEVYTEEKPLTSFSDAKLHVVEGFAALGSHVYAFGGGLAIPFCPSDVCKLDVTGRGAYGFDSVSSMIAPKFCSHNFVLDGKIYVFSSRQMNMPPTAHWGEVFDPHNGKWEALPDPPYDSSFTIISAALENPNRILVAFHVSDTWYSAMFYAYNVQHRSWEMLAPAQRNIHPHYPKGSTQRTVTVHNTLYWFTLVNDEVFLIAYNLDLDMWLEGSLKDFGIFYDTPICLFHLDKQRFCLLQTLTGEITPDGNIPLDADLYCIVVDVSHMPGENRLGISLAWKQMFKVDCPYPFSDCLLL